MRYASSSASPLVMYSSDDRSGSNRLPVISHSSSSGFQTLSAIAESIVVAGERLEDRRRPGSVVYCWKPSGHSSSSAAVWSFFMNVKSTMSQSFFIAWVSASESGPGPR